ncbi:MAG TPA: GNAT family N-acetyltransferase [Rubrobacter sp.]|nr:GNAT family N-acetyltransferase [Rubrobacter sp.]
MVLRRFNRADLDHLFVLHNDPEVMRYLNGGKPTTRREIGHEYHTRFVRDGYWTAIEKATGDFLGWFGFHPTESRGTDEFELGYRLKRLVWGKGFATEGSRALIRKGFTELGVRRVVAETMAVNLASRRVMEKSGLTHVRAFHEDWSDPIAGAEHGEVEYEITRAAWERQDAEGCWWTSEENGTGYSPG